MERPEITIVLNGVEERVKAGTTISKLLEQFGQGDDYSLVERNGRYIYPKHYPETEVQDGDRIELINPNFGG